MALSFWAIYLAYFLLIIIKYHIDKKKNSINNDQSVNNFETELTTELGETQNYDTNTGNYDNKEPRKDSVDISVSGIMTNNRLNETNNITVNYNSSINNLDQTMLSTRPANYDKRKFNNFEAKFNAKEVQGEGQKEVEIDKQPNKEENKNSGENSIILNASAAEIDYADRKNNCKNKCLQIIKSPFKSILEYTIFPIEIHNLKSCFLPWYPVTGTAAALV